MHRVRPDTGWIVCGAQGVHLVRPTPVAKDEQLNHVTELKG